MVSGGYRKPETPAPVSGPGALSQRTDGGPSQAPMYMPGMKSLGSTGREQAAFAAAAPLYKGGVSADAVTKATLPKVTPITADTEFPDQPITDGTTAPGGMGPEALNLPLQTDNSADKARLMSYLPAWENAANLPTTSVAFKNYVRLVRSMV